MKFSQIERGINKFFCCFQGGGPPPNLSISRQMTMKLDKDILLVKIVTKWQKVLMTSSSG